MSNDTSLKPPSGPMPVPAPPSDLDAIPARWPLMLMYALPKHALSRCAGWCARYRFSTRVQAWLNRGFVRLFGVQAEEAELPVESYPSIQALFTRRLRPGLRPCQVAADQLASPVDGAWGASGVAAGDRALQVKGRDYSVEQLLGGGELAQCFRDAAFATLYLSPRDYHRIHSPARAYLTQVRYLPGRLWPVSLRAVHHIDDLFARNERLVLFFDTAFGRMALVAVGATMVGRTVLEFDDLTTNVRGAQTVERAYDRLPFDRGQELGRFEFGSTVVLLMERGAGLFVEPAAGTPVRLGEVIAELRPVEAGR